MFPTPPPHIFFVPIPLAIFPFLTKKNLIPAINSHSSPSTAFVHQFRPSSYISHNTSSGTEINVFYELENMRELDNSSNPILSFRSCCRSQDPSIDYSDPQFPFSQHPIHPSFSYPTIFKLPILPYPLPCQFPHFSAPKKLQTVHEKKNYRKRIWRRDEAVWCSCDGELGS